LAGQTPNHECETLGQLVMAICGGHGVPLAQRAPSLSPPILALVARATALDPQARFQTALEMQREIMKLLPHGAQLTDALVADGGGGALQRTVALPKDAVPVPPPALPSSPSSPSSPSLPSSPSSPSLPSSPSFPTPA